MRKIWKVIGILVLVVIILGAICVGVGLLTNADYSRIFQVLDAEFNISVIYQQVSESLGSIIDMNAF